MGSVAARQKPACRRLLSVRAAGDAEKAARGQQPEQREYAQQPGEVHAQRGLRVPGRYQQHDAARGHDERDDQVDYLVQQAAPGKGHAGVRRAGQAEVLLIVPREAEHGARGGYAEDGQHDSPEAAGDVEPVLLKGRHVLQPAAEDAEGGVHAGRAGHCKGEFTHMVRTVQIRIVT